MKTFIALLLCCTILAVKAEDQIQIVRHGTNVTERPSAALATSVVDLVKSCLYPNYFPVEAETWQKFEHSDSFVLVTFATPSKVEVKIVDGYWEQRKFKLKRESKIIIDQILVPLTGGAGPRLIFAKSGTNVLSFSKWDSKAMEMVVSEPALHMSLRYYKSRADIKRSNK